MKKSIVLCADDYGQAKAISAAIINLVQNDRLSATSCMVNTDYWPEHAKWLQPFQEKIDIGLHFNFTDGKALSDEFKRKHGEYFPSLTTVMRLALMRTLSGAAIEAELHAQIDRFAEMLGFLPDHIDGHQHVHQFPVIREALIRVHQKRLRANKTYIRLINPSFKISDVVKNPKKLIVYAMGTVPMRQLLLLQGIPHNQTFAGIYAFDLYKQYPQYFRYFLQEIGNQGLIMCHPGFASGPEDSISDARLAEFQYLGGDQFVSDNEAAGVVIKRFERGLVL